jgi:hypothetical protein
MTVPEDGTRMGKKIFYPCPILLLFFFFTIYSYKDYYYVYFLTTHLLYRPLSVKHFRSQVVPTSCTECNAGKYGNMLGSSSEGDCTDCQKGSYSGEIGRGSQNFCQECDAGTYGSE